MRPRKSTEELALMAEMGAWFKDVRETQEMNVTEFGKFIGLKDREIRMIESGRSEVSDMTRKLIKRRTGREFGEILDGNPEMERLEEDRPPLVRVKPEVLAARQKVLSERAPKNEDERQAVSDWLRSEMKRYGLKTKTLCELTGLPVHTLTNLLYNNTRLNEVMRTKITVVFENLARENREKLVNNYPCPIEKKKIPPVRYRLHLILEELHRMDNSSFEQFHDHSTKVINLFSEIDKILSDG